MSRRYVTAPHPSTSTVGQIESIDRRPPKSGLFYLQLLISLARWIILFTILFSFHQFHTTTTTFLHLIHQYLLLLLLPLHITEKYPSHIVSLFSINLPFLLSRMPAITLRFFFFQLFSLRLLRTYIKINARKVVCFSSFPFCLRHFTGLISC